MERIEQIKTDEGYRENIYLCSQGKLSWLYGRNIKDRPIKKDEWLLLESLLQQGFSMKDWADKLFDIELINLEAVLYHVYKIRLLDDTGIPSDVRVIILNMSYNMGLTKFNPDKWPNFFKAINERNWKQAAIEGRDSLWFNQVGIRSKRLMISLESIDIAT